MSIREYAGALAQVVATLASAAASADAALRELTGARAILKTLAPDGGGWYPAELDLAIAELTKAASLAAAARRRSPTT
ncbi:hypothetical protein ACFQV2_22500 [Actinokineospora soli]|uniref:Uncharacterized protein n=1 Tax=Actinokineospora soli TaxID=1048753 RepID=A0ABW2TPW9_9PSEU